MTVSQCGNRNSFPWETKAIIIFVFSCHVILSTLFLCECCGCAKNICIMTWIFYLTCAFLWNDSFSYTYTHTHFFFLLTCYLFFFSFFTKKRGSTDQIFPLGYFCFSFVRLSLSHKHASHYFFSTANLATNMHTYFFMIIIMLHFFLNIRLTLSSCRIPRPKNPSNTNMTCGKTKC